VNRTIPVNMALPGLVIAAGMIGDTLLYALLPLYHQHFGLSLVMACWRWARAAISA
jgi:hypothetical protein